MTDREKYAREKKRNARGDFFNRVAPWRRGGEAGDRNGPKGHISVEAVM